MRYALCLDSIERSRNDDKADLQHGDLMVVMSLRVVIMRVTVLLMRGHWVRFLVRVCVSMSIALRMIVRIPVSMVVSMVVTMFGLECPVFHKPHDLHGQLCLFRASFSSIANSAANEGRHAFFPAPNSHLQYLLVCRLLLDLNIERNDRDLWLFAGTL